MKTKQFFICFISCLFASVGMFAKNEVNVDKVTSSLTLSEAVDYHITASEECIAADATIDLTNEDAWLFFDNVRPTEVKSKWLSKIKVNGQSVIAQQTAWVNIYMHGAVVIPHAKNFTPLTIYTGEAYGGDANSYAPGKYASLGKFDNAIKSFKLKRGYMVTMAQSKDGTGYSRCFIAQDKDIEIPNLLDKNSCTRGGALYNKVSYIRVMRWQMPDKKGAVDTDPAKTDATWYYNYDASNASKSDDYEYANMWHHDNWNTGAQNGNVSEVGGVTHTLFFNEPWNPSDDGYMGTDALAPIPYQQRLIKCGLRIGSTASTDGNVGKTKAFVKECDRLGLRVDFVALHIYQYHDAQWWWDYTYNIYKETGRPVWITEWNNGANWTSEYWPSDLASQWVKSRDITKEVCEKLASAPWVERFSLYNAVEIKRNIVYQGGTTSVTIDGVTKTYNNGDLTPAGEVYKALKPGLAYNPEYEFIPVYPTFEKPTVELKTGLLMSLGRVTINVKDNNGEYLDKIVVEKKVGNGDYEVVKESTTSINNWNDNWDREHPQKTTYKFSFYYCNETDPEKNFIQEETIDVDVAENTPVRYGTALLSKPDYSYIMYEPFEDPKAAIPIVGGVGTASLTTGQTNQFTYGLNTVASGTTNNNFRMRALPWGFIYEYDESKLNSMTYTGTASIPYMVVDSAAISLQGKPVEAGIVKEVTEEWMQVKFKIPFEEAPVVFPSLLSNYNFGENSGPAYVRVRNVTADGFEVKITRESKLGTAALWKAENIGYYAIPKGKIEIPVENGEILHVYVDCTDAVNGALTSTVVTNFPETYPVVPTLISALQSANDEYTVSLVNGALGKSSVRFYKMREKSTSTQTTCSKDEVGYILFYKTTPDAIENVESDSSKDFTVYEYNGKLYVEGIQGEAVSLYTTNGTLVLSAKVMDGIDVSALPTGYYIVHSDKGEKGRFIKK